MNSVVIVAAGSGTRMGPGIDKLFLELAGRPVIAHTWARFDAAADVDEIVLVVRAGLEAAFAELAAQYGFRRPFRCVAGGRERQDSVWNGLATIAGDDGLVAIHDGARPCVTSALITAVFAAAGVDGAAVAAQRTVDTVKESDGGTWITGHLDRARLWAVQTPQAFRLSVIRRAIAAARERGLQLTDDTAACGLIQQRVRLVPSETPNPKVTSRADLPLIEWQLRTQNPA